MEVVGDEHYRRCGCVHESVWNIAGVGDVVGAKVEVDDPVGMKVAISARTVFTQEDETSSVWNGQNLQILTHDTLAIDIRLKIHHRLPWIKHILLMCRFRFTILLPQHPQVMTCPFRSILQIC